MKAKVTISFLLLIIILLSIVQVVVSNILSTTGIDLSKMQEEIDTYKKENALLKEEVLKSGSLTRISGIVEEKGYISASNVFISTTLPLAIKR